MALSQKQKGVFAGIAVGLVLVTGGLVSARLFAAKLPLPVDTIPARLRFVAPWLLLLIAPFGAMIGNLARHRFFTPEDIDGSGLTRGTDKANIYQAILQNTLEQLALALPLHLVYALWMPRHWLGVVPLCACFFLVGRVLFALGYRNGAPSRAVGFALTFYPSMAMLALALAHWAFGL